MSIESEGAGSNVELGLVSACEGDLPCMRRSTSKQSRRHRKNRSARRAWRLSRPKSSRCWERRSCASQLLRCTNSRYHHGDGGFEGWVERRLKMSRRTAYTFSMREMPRPAWRCGPCRSSGLHPCSVYFTEVSLELGHAPSPFQCRPTVGAHRQ